MLIKIIPGVAQGKIHAAPSKSMAHRLLICAALSQGESLISPIDLSEDIKATLSCLRALGAKIHYQDRQVYVQGINPVQQPRPILLNCQESGSTLRFLIPIALLWNLPIIFQGSRHLFERPLSVYENIFGTNPNLQFKKSTKQLLVQGKLEATSYSLSGNISSQFISGLLFALPYIKSDKHSEIQVTAPIESLSYILLTVDTLKQFGIDIQIESKKCLPNQNLRWIVPAGQKSFAQKKRVEGDYSNAAFFAALNYLRLENNVEITGLNPDSLQSDKAYIKIFKQLANPKTAKNSISLADCPDLAPIAFCIASALYGGNFTDTKRLAYKESSRAEAICAELKKFGGKSLIGENEVKIIKTRLKRPKQNLHAHHDHRIVMALAILASLYGGNIEGAEAVNKSFPDFFEQLKACGIHIE